MNKPKIKPTKKHSDESTLKLELEFTNQKVRYKISLLRWGTFVVKFFVLFFIFLVIFSLCSIYIPEFNAFLNIDMVTQIKIEKYFYNILWVY